MLGVWLIRGRRRARPTPQPPRGDPHPHARPPLQALARNVEDIMSKGTMVTCTAATPIDDGKSRDPPRASPHRRRRRRRSPPPSRRPAGPSAPAVLQLLVENHVTGLPVINAEGVVVGVVSDFDLLALEGVKEADRRGGLFPECGTEWSSFFEVQQLIIKNAGKW